MRLRILGPVEVRDPDGRLVPVRRRARVLAGVLSLRANSAVPVDWIVDALWGESPPRSAGVNLRSHVAELRRPLPNGSIETGRGSYRLTVAAPELDVLAFDALADEGRRHLTGERHELAVERLARAAGLWRGPVLGGVPVPDAVQPLVRGLDDRRLDAVEDCQQARLALGQHAAAAAELRVLTEQHPLRERLWGQLMLALHRSGRTPDAVAAYRRLCTLLDEELGVGPSEPVRLLHQRIVRADPTLGTVPSPAAVHVTRPVPRQLPPDATAFVGRAGHLAELDAATGIVAISGTAGVGKTALAVHWAHSRPERFPDGHLYADLRGYGPQEPLRAAAVLGGFLRGLGMGAGEQPYEPAELTAAYRTLLADRRVLVVLDNARSAEQVRPLLPGAPGCLVLVTSRDGLPGLIARDGARGIELDLLAPDEAVTLVRRLVGERVDAEPEAAVELADTCARLPLALRIAAELANRRPSDTLAELVRALADRRRRLDLLDAGGDSHTAVRAVFHRSYEALEPVLAAAFRLLALHPGRDMEVHSAAALTGTAPDVAARLVHQLGCAHLVRLDGNGRHGMHDLLRVYATERVTARERDEALTRLFDHYAHTAEAAAAHFRRGAAPSPPLAGPELADLAAATRWLDAELANLVALAEHGVRHGRPAHVCALARSLRPYLDGSANYRDALAIHEQAVAAARLLCDRAAEGLALHCVGGVNGRLGRYREAAAALEKALAVRSGLGDRAGAASTRNNLAVVYQRLGRHHEAAECYRQALVGLREAGDLTSEGMVLGNLALLDWRLGRYAEAADGHEQALHVFRRLGDPGPEGVELGNLAVLLSRLGRHHEAIEHAMRALDIATEVGDRAATGSACGNLAAAHTGLGDYDRAMEYADRALTLHRRLGDRDSEAAVLVHRGHILRLTGRLDEALTAHRQAVELAREVGGDTALEAQALDGVAATLLDAGSPHEAADTHRAALALATAGEHHYELARAHHGLGSAAAATGDHETARHHWLTALSGYTALGVPDADEVRATLTTPG